MEHSKERELEALKEVAHNLPKSPGIYLMKDKKGAIIYIGKAKNLKNRVRSYFSGDKDIKTSILVKRIASIDHIITKNEYEALLLENTLIKEHTPRYNINLKDGKTYPVIRITAEDFPRIFRTRKIVQDGSQYYGPFPQIQLIDRYLELIARLFPIRKCRGFLKPRKSPCLYYHIGRCKAPCTGQISKEAYATYVEQVKMLLSGKIDSLIEDLKSKMEKASSSMHYESAKELRDTITAIKEINEEQKVVDFDEESRDYIAFAIEETLCTFVVLKMRSGKLTGKDMFRTEIFTSEEEAVTDFILQYYTKETLPPSRLFIPFTIDTSLLISFFKKELAQDTEILTPETGKDASIMRMASENASEDVRKQLFDAKKTTSIRDLAKILGLKQLPNRIEGFDIAQLDGKYPVASMVSFWKGTPDKANYRLFHIKSLNGKIDDFEAIREVMARRYSRVQNEELEKPDLILIDGGKGQVSAAQGILTMLGLENIPLVGLAKQNEELFLPSAAEPIILPDGSQPLRLLQHVRDEAHRFATSFNKKLRGKTDISLSSFKGISGIGEKRSRLLLKTFGSIQALLEQDPTAIAFVCKISKDKALELKIHLEQKLKSAAVKPFRATDHASRQ